jgi:hypothetical protein
MKQFRSIKKKSDHFKTSFVGSLIGSFIAFIVYVIYLLILK